MARSLETKRKAIEEILANPVYRPDSGAYMTLYASLLRLSDSDLQLLALFVSLKTRSETNVRRPDGVRPDPATTRG